MPFVNELIPDNAKKTFDFDSVRKRTLFGNPLELFMWVGDRDRDAYLISLGGGGGPRGAEIPYRHALWWKGDVIEFEGATSVKGGVLTWLNPRVYVPKHLETRRAEFIALLKEALDAMGWLYDRKNIKNVVVDIR